MMKTVYIIKYVATSSLPICFVPNILRISRVCILNDIGRGYIGKLNATFLLGLYFVDYVSAHIVAMLSEMQAPDISRSDNSGRKCTKQSDTEYPTEFDLFSITN